MVEARAGAGRQDVVSTVLIRFCLTMGVVATGKQRTLRSRELTVVNSTRSAISRTAILNTSAAEHGLLLTHSFSATETGMLST